jgi:hypothetical protein
MVQWRKTAGRVLQRLGWPGGKAAGLAELRAELSEVIGGKRCLVIGSAPGARIPDRSRFDVCVCVNGSPWTAARFGIPKPDLTVVSGHKTKVRDYDVALATLKAWQGLDTRMLLFVEVGDDASHARRIFAKTGFHYDVFRSIDSEGRTAIIRAACGDEMAASSARVSNGIFAAIAAMWAGAQEIVFSGFSMKGGHSYMEQETRRGHQEGDSHFFSSTGRFACTITTTSDELHRSFGLPMAD